MPAASAQPRRTQEQRSTEMRERLMEATIDCLVEYGWSGTTTAKVADRAGVTRGAQVHHFPTKADLVVAAIRYMATQKIKVAYDETRHLSKADKPLGDVLDLIWNAHQGPIFAVTMELMIAARTDPELRAHVAELEPLITGGTMELSRKVSPDYTYQSQFLHFLYTATDTVRGILVGSWAFVDDTQTEARWQRAKDQLIAMGEASLSRSKPNRPL